MATTLTADASNQKERGGYYTPPAIAQFLADWVIRTPQDTVLEPSCGDGELLEASARRLLLLGAASYNAAEQLHAVELYGSEAAQARARLERLGIAGEKAVTEGDFFCESDGLWGLAERDYDAVVGNPPFLRYHSFPDDQRERAFRIMRTAGLTPTKLTNSWVAFLVASSLRLKPSGRLAMVIPAELLQVKYAAQTRAFLARCFGAITIVTFRRLVFAGIQQEVVLLLAEKSPHMESGIDVIELDIAEDLASSQVTLRARPHLKTIDHAEEKWTQYYLDAAEIDLLRVLKTHPAAVPFGKIGSVDVGVVTGENSFFVLSEEQVRLRGLADHTLPLVGRTAQLPGLAFRESDWQANRQAQILCHLLNLPAVSFNALPEAAQAYVRAGEALGVHTGYKCRIRPRWYVVPTLWTPDAFLFRQIHEYPKLVQNVSGATSTDTIHRVRFHEPSLVRQSAPAFLNSLTFAFAEVLDRSYGGGVLELEPSEAELLPVPLFAGHALDFDEIDRLERTRSIDAILDITDAELLRGRMGLDGRDVQMLRGIWRKLSGRRVGRKAKRGQ